MFLELSGYGSTVALLCQGLGRGGGGWTRPCHGNEGSRHALAVAVRGGNRRVAVLAVAGKKQPSNRPIKHVTNVIARTFPDARRYYYHTTNAAQTSHMWTHNRYSLSTIRNDASTTKLPDASLSRARGDTRS